MPRAAWTQPDPRSCSLASGFWAGRAALNRERALPYQWGRYEEAGTVDNFRVAGGLIEGVRRGFFYTDSDLHKWADAACRALRQAPSSELERLLDEYARVAAAAQEPDGYLFTYNQILFPGTRWKNLMIEHELYCFGHFIEAGVSAAECLSRDDLLALAERSAQLVVREFRDGPSERTSGHEEIELALIRLYRLTRKYEYLETARAMLERRGRIRIFGPKLLAQLASQAARSKSAARGEPESHASNASHNASSTEPQPSVGFEVGGNMRAKKGPFARRREPPFLALRALPIFLGGAYQQQDRPLRGQAEPRGHAVRWTYLMAAAAMLYAESGDESLKPLLEGAWERLLGRKMYATGGLGALPLIEGFGRAYELDNFYSYSETCAAIGCALWNRELSIALGDARYASLVEWLLYNAASVGIASSGDRYFYRNPLAADGELERKPWFATACCPSNLSRLWADSDRLAFAVARPEIGDGLSRASALRIDQYIGANLSLEDGSRVATSSGLPWSGSVSIRVEARRALSLELRIPFWCDLFRTTRTSGTGPRVVENHDLERGAVAGEKLFGPELFSTRYATLELPAGASEVELEMGMPVFALRAHPRVRCDRGRVAICRGPLIYCAEAADNLGIDLDEASVDPKDLSPAEHPDLPGAVMLEIRAAASARAATADAVARLVPYYLWGNRGPQLMRVFLRSRR